MAGVNETELRSLVEQYQQTHQDVHLENLFKLFDRNHDGHLSKQEIIETLNRLGYNGQSESVATSMVQIGDTDRDSFLNKPEFISFGRIAFSS